MTWNSFYRLLVSAGLVCLLTAGIAAHTVAKRESPAGNRRDSNSGGGIVTAEQRLAAEPTVTLLACVESGDVVVRGWDRNEVRARSDDAERIELRRADATTESNPASRIEVLVSREEAGSPQPGLCSNSGNLQLDVPRGSIVQIKGNTGDISIADVSTVRAKTLSGDIELQRIAKLIEAWSANGTIILRNSSGRARLETISGEIVASDLATDDTGDELFVKSVSGDISLAKIAHTHVEAISTNSPIDFSGTLVNGGLYTFKSHSGNVTLTLPPGSSFQLSAKVYESGEIITDFPIRQVAGTMASDKSHDSAPAVGGPLLNAGRLTGVTGKGDKSNATLVLSSFNGTLHLQQVK
ncbi:MAG: DUF4097 family beta strand repeat-containing protein [Pyrinomonadaceae bacterium]